jgi:asparagine synthase (glutamine-hydrolysing)
MRKLPASFSRFAIAPAVFARMCDRFARRAPGHGGLRRGRTRIPRIQGLSIIDLDDCFNQPISRPSPGFGVMFNGELYDGEIGQAWLGSKGVPFRTETNTEVLLDECSRRRLQSRKGRGP